MRVRTASALVLAAATSFARPSHAEPPGSSAPPIFVVAVRSDDAEDQAEALTSALRSRVRAMRGHSLGEGDFSLEVLSLALKCPDVPDAGCESRIAERIHADGFLWGVLRRAKAKGQVVAELHYWRRDAAGVSTELRYSDNLTVAGDESLRRLVDEALAKLVGPGAPAKVRVRADLEEGDLLVDGIASGKLRAHEALLELPPGEHEVVVRGGEGVVERGTVSVRVGEAIELALTPDVAPASRPRRKAEPADDAAPTRLRPIVGWATVGLGGALLLGGASQSVVVHNAQTDGGFAAYRNGVPRGEDACDRARAGLASADPTAPGPSQIVSLCDDASRARTLQWVLYGLGAVATGVGVYLLVSDEAPAPAPKAGRIELVPTMGARGGGVDVAVAF